MIRFPRPVPVQFIDVWYDQAVAEVEQNPELKHDHLARAVFISNYIETMEVAYKPCREANRELARTLEATI